MRALRCALVLALVALCAPLSGCVSIDLLAGPPRPLVETTVYGEAGPKILLLEIDGVISEEPPDPDIIEPVRDSMVSRVREQLDRARKDDQVRALLLRINSPGGTATASDVIHDEIQRFKRERGVPVVAQLMGTATSGAYYVAMVADLVIAHPTTVTGSIGVIFISVNLVGLMEKLGIEDQTLVSGARKDAGSPLRRMTREERAHMQSVLDDLHARFIGVVRAGRPRLDEERVEELADGSIFSAPQAREHGLVDEIGDLQLAVAHARTRAGLATARVVTYHRPREHANNLYTGPSPPPVLRLELPDPLRRLQRPGFYFLWLRGL